MVRIQTGLPLAEELVAVAASASGMLLTHVTVAETLKLITSAAKLSLPAAIGAGVTLLDANAHKTSTAFSDAVVERVDLAQYKLEQGPCLSAWATAETVVVNDIAQDTRWPLWSRAVSSLAVAASISAPLLSTGGEAFGAVKVYSNRTGSFDDRSRQILELLAAQAAVLILNAQTRENAERLSDDLQHALRTRDLIGMAKGLIMARHGVDEEGAIRHLIKESANSHLPLRTVSLGIIEAAAAQRS